MPHCSTPPPSLSRLLDHENQVCDVIAVLSDLASEPLREMLDLPAGDISVRREVLHSYPNPDPNGKRKNVQCRIDLVVYVDLKPRKLLEVKMSAGVHGEQFSGYENWAETHGLHPSDCYLVTLAGETVPGAPPDWCVKLTLPTLLEGWTQDTEEHVAWLAQGALAVLADRAAQFDGKLGNATHPVVADLVAKQLVSDLIHSSPDDVHVNRSARGRGGADVLAWIQLLPHGQVDDVNLSVELQVGTNTHPSMPWRLRVGVEAWENDARTAAAAIASHDMAMRALPHTNPDALRVALRKAGEHLLANALSSNGFDGLKSADLEKGDDWRTQAEQAGTGSASKLPPHPFFYVYWNTRMSNQLSVDVSELDRHQLLRLLEVVCVHLARTAADLGRAGHEAG